jgi:hypothetical protein
MFKVSPQTTDWKPGIISEVVFGMARVSPYYFYTVRTFSKASGVSIHPLIRSSEIRTVSPHRAARIERVMRDVILITTARQHAQARKMEQAHAIASARVLRESYTTPPKMSAGLHAASHEAKSPEPAAAVKPAEPEVEKPRHIYFKHIDPQK